MSAYASPENAFSLLFTCRFEPLSKVHVDLTCVVRFRFARPPAMAASPNMAVLRYSTQPETAHLEARAALFPQLTPSPRARMAEFFLATTAKVSAIGLPAFSAVY